MTDYTKLVKALRCKCDDCEGCDLAFFDKDEGWMCQYAAKDDDAAAAIEALIADVEKKESRITGLGNRIFALEKQLPKRGEMVRCGECKYRTELAPTKWHPCVDMAVNDDWYCADGEREVQE